MTSASRFEKRSRSGPSKGASLPIVHGSSPCRWQQTSTEARETTAATKQGKQMNTRTRLREIVAEPGLSVWPGAYDALSAKLIERAGFDAIVAGGDAAIGS